VLVLFAGLNKLITLGDSSFVFHVDVDAVELRFVVVDDDDDDTAGTDEDDLNAPGAALNNGVVGGLIPIVVVVSADLNPTFD